MSKAHEGHIHSEEHKSRISKAMNGKQNCLGKTVPPEVRAKISDALKGRVPWNKGVNTKAQGERQDELR